MKLCGCSQPSAARWTYEDGASGTLCQVHLDMWLDIADDDPELEPAALAFI